MQKKENSFSNAEDEAENDLCLELARLCDGLSYISETDAAMEVFVGQKARRISREEILSQTGHGDFEPIEEISIEGFFRKLTTVREWYNAQQVADAGRCGELKKLLQDSLTDIHVFQIGRIQIGIFVVGLDPSQNLVGIKTKAVET
ncbi:MAG: nuclease A inhibitor family protein [Acidobacteriota bacterium]